PAMILLGGSEGGDSFAKLAPMFAARGYVAASVAYFGTPGLPDTLTNIPVETVGKAIDALQARPDVNPSAIGLLGTSKGGELTLLAASTYPQIKAVVAIVPSPVAFMGLGEFNIPTGCSWTKDAKPLPCVPADAAAGAAVGQEFQAHKPIVLAPMYDASLDANPNVTQAAFFPLQNIAGPVLCLAGSDDKMWDSSRQCSMAMQYLKAHNHEYGDKMIAYPNAGHMFLFTLHGPSSAITSYAAGPATLAFGGTAEGDAAAADAAWPAIWSFLAASLRR
ncbi:MAG: acyl-CoA thioester hydrolase/BAAT C-terminal domain-containing protein, partial [Candidatus Baltobacteraceae bacterium]